MKTTQYKAKIFYTQSVIANVFKHQCSILCLIEYKNLCLYQKYLCIYNKLYITIRKFNCYSIFYLILTN